MQIHEITRLNENALGAFASGAASALGVPGDVSGAIGSIGGGSALPGYGDARQKAAAAAAKPLIAARAKKEMQGWNTAIADQIKQKQVQAARDLDSSSQKALERDLFNRLHDVFMQGKLGNNYVQSLPASVDDLRQPAAKDLVNRLNLATQAIMNFDRPTTNAQEQLKQWQNLSQTAYDAMSLAQFYPDRTRTAPTPKLKIVANPGGGFNIGDSPAGRLSSNPADTVITQKIQAELKARPDSSLEIKSFNDGSITIGSQRLDARTPNEAKAIQRIKSLVTAPASNTAGNTSNPGGIIIPAGARTAESIEKKRIASANLAYKSKHKK